LRIDSIGIDSIGIVGLPRVPPSVLIYAGSSLSESHITYRERLFQLNSEWRPRRHYCLFTFLQQHRGNSRARAKNSAYRRAFTSTRYSAENRPESPASTDKNDFAFVPFSRDASLIVYPSPRARIIRGQYPHQTHASTIRKEQVAKFNGYRA
jgi:hypothetical protein